MKHMLLVFAHPDDESFMTGGTIAKYVDAGWEVDLICATRGENGDTGPKTNLAREKVGEVRQKELQEAGTILGVHSITFFDYKDGTLSERTPGDVEDMVHKKMMELIPDIVITMDTTGVTNHPDHIKLSYATTYAFQKYAKWIEERLKDQEPKEQIFPKLYYVCIPESIVRYAVTQKALSTESFGKPRRGVHDKQITTVVDVSEFSQLKQKAIRCHITQTKNVNEFLAIPGKALMKKEYYIFRMHGTTEVFMGKNDHVLNNL